MKAKKLLLVLMVTLLLLTPHNCWATAFIDRADCELAWLMEINEDPITDSSSNSFTGTAAANPTHTTSSPPAGGFSTGYWDYDGIGDEHKNVDGVTTIDVNEYTICFWMNPDDETAEDAPFTLASGTGSNTQTVLIRIMGNVSGDPYRWTQNTNGTTGRWDTDTDFTAGIWDHFAGHIDITNINNTPTIYVNGVKKTVGSGLTEDQNPTGTFDTGHDSISVGETQSGGADFNGQLDEVAVFITALTETDIGNIFNNGLESDDAGAAPTRNRAMMLSQLDFDYELEEIA